MNEPSSRVGYAQALAAPDAGALVSRPLIPLDVHGAHGVEDGDRRHAHVAEDREPHVRDADRRQREDEHLDADGEHDVLVHDAHGLARYADGAGDVARLVVHEDDVRGLDGGVRAHGAHGDAHIGAGEHGGVVDAVAHEGEVAAGGVEDALHLLDLVAGQQLGVVFVQAEFCCDGARHLLAVAGEHNAAIDARGVQIADGLLGIVLHHIGDDDMAGIRAVDGDVQDGAGELAVMPIRAVGGHQLVVAHEHHVLIDGGLDSVAGFLGGLRDARLVDVAVVGLLDGDGDRMVGERFRVRRHGQHVIGVDAVLGVDGDHVEGAGCEGAGLVEHDGVDLRQRLEVVGALDEDAELGRPADAAEERQRHADDQGARAAHHEEGESAQDPIGPRLHAHQRRDDGDRQRREGDDGRVDACESRDEVLGVRLFLARVLHEFEDAAHGRGAEELGGADAQDARHVDAAGDDLRALLHVARHRFAGEGGGVELGGSIDDDAVDGNTLTGLDHDDVAYLHLVGIDLRQRPIALDVRVVGRDVHHGRDGFAALAHGIALEQLADLVEQHDGRALRHMRLGVGEEDHGERADGGDGHEEALVEGLAATDVAPRLEKHVVPGDEVGDEVEREARVQRAGLSEDAREYA